MEELGASALAAQQLNPNPVPAGATTLPSIADMMEMQAKQSREKDSLANQQRVSQALLQGMQSQPSQPWKSKRENRFVSNTSPATGLAGIGKQLGGAAMAYGNQQEQDRLRAKQQQDLLRLTPMPPTSTQMEERRASQDLSNQQTPFYE